LYDNSLSFSFYISFYFRDLIEVGFVTNIENQARFICRRSV